MILFQFDFFSFPALHTFWKNVYKNRTYHFTGMTYRPNVSYNLSDRISEEKKILQNVTNPRAVAKWQTLVEWYLLGASSETYLPSAENFSIASARVKKFPVDLDIFSLLSMRWPLQRVPLGHLYQDWKRVDHYIIYINIQINIKQRVIFFL